jgi:hypothetical protein
MKRDVLALSLIILAFVFNSVLYLHRHMNANPVSDPPCNPAVFDAPRHEKRVANTTQRHIAGFYHLAMDGPWKEIFYDQMQKLRARGLLNHSDFLFINAVGERSDWVPLRRLGIPSDKIFMSFHGALDDYEAPTHEYLQRYCNGFPQSLVYYFHSKGVTHPESPLKEKIIQWRVLMEQFLLTEWRDCVEALLDGNVACGVNLQRVREYGAPWPHFSGNFWWARCDHINRLPPPLDLGTPYFKEHDQMKSRRHYAEAWILDTGSAELPRLRSCHDSKVNHYEVLYVVPNLTALRCTQGL